MDVLVAGRGAARSLRDVSEQLPPARPHLKFTDEGRRVREVLSYARRGSRFTPSQQESWDAHHEKWVIPDEAVDSPEFSLTSWFGREAPLVVEVGSGIGEATAALAAARPEVNILAFEVWRPGVADSLWRVAEAGASNVRFCGVDAVWSLEHLFAEGSVSELWTFFPDPWPKQRHHRRRLVTPDFAQIAARRLAPGALWRLATDWPAYASQMVAVLSAEDLLENVHEGAAPRWDERPVTRFERRGVRAGHPITDLTFRRL